MALLLIVPIIIYFLYSGKVTKELPDSRSTHDSTKTNVPVTTASPKRNDQPASKKNSPNPQPSPKPSPD
jgi:hypothetical protein